MKQRGDLSPEARKRSFPEFGGSQAHKRPLCVRFQSESFHKDTTVSWTAGHTRSARCPRTDCIAISHRRRPPRRLTGAAGPKEAIKRWPPFSRPSPKKNGRILVMNNQNSRQGVARAERHICSPREVGYEGVEGGGERGGG